MLKVYDKIKLKYFNDTKVYLYNNKTLVVLSRDIFNYLFFEDDSVPFLYWYNVTVNTKDKNFRKNVIDDKKNNLSYFTLSFAKKICSEYIIEPEYGIIKELNRISNKYKKSLKKEETKNNKK